MLKQLRQALFALATAVMLSGCSSAEISQLQGVWEYVNLNDLGDPTIYTWEFSASNTLTFRRYPEPTEDIPNPPPVVIGVAEFETSAEFLDAVVIIRKLSTQSSYVLGQVSGCCTGDEETAWTILTVSDTYLRLGTSEVGGYVVREFQRVR